MNLSGANQVSGLFFRDRSPLTAAIHTGKPARLDTAVSIWLEGPPVPRQDGPFPVSQPPGALFAGWGRVDNRTELSAALGLSPDAPDAVFLEQAWLRWGDAAPARLHGDWLFAAWQPDQGRLFLARDPFGVTALYYYAAPGLFAFSTSRQSLIELQPGPLSLDELYLAQMLVSWPGYHDGRTIHSPIRRLPPAHWVAVTPGELHEQCYWRLEDTPELHLPRREDYLEPFRQVFDEAVRARLRLPGRDPQTLKIAATLSGGLDSGSVAATAAAMLRPAGRRLQGFTSVPIAATGENAARRFGDELPFASSTARSAGNIELHTIDAAALSPVAALRRALEIHLEPGHAAGNQFWMLELLQAARNSGCDLLLTGQLGNAGFSWTGSVFSQPLAYQVRKLGPFPWLAESLKRVTPNPLRIAIQKRRIRLLDWCRASAIHPEFAARLNLLERRLEDPTERPAHEPRQQRLRIIMPGRSFIGSLWAENSAAFGLPIFDPTADPRLLAFSLSIPDRHFIDPASGFDRWIVREAMRGRLPDEVRLNRRRGLQAADLVHRLRACAAEVDAALDEIRAGPAAAYVDVAHMGEVWQGIQTRATPQELVNAGVILMRGLMAGMFVNRFYGFSKDGGNAPGLA